MLLDALILVDCATTVFCLVDSASAWSSQLSSSLGGVTGLGAAALKAKRKWSTIFTPTNILTWNEHLCVGIHVECEILSNLMKDMKKFCKKSLSFYI